jgi:hypothetical protein
MTEYESKKIIDLNGKVILYDYIKYNDVSDSIIKNDYKEIALKTDLTESFNAMLDFKDNTGQIIKYANKTLKLSWMMYGFNAFDLESKLPKDTSDVFYYDHTPDFLLVDILSFLCSNLGDISIEEEKHSFIEMNELQGYDFIELEYVMKKALENKASISCVNLFNLLNMMNGNENFFKILERIKKLEKF